MDTKNNLLTVLYNAKMSYLAGCLAGYTLVETNPVALKDTLNIQNEHFPEDTQILDVSIIKSILLIPRERQLLKNEYSKTIIRAFIRDTFEFISNYAENSDQLDNICRESSLFQFTRLIRNGLAHNFKFKFFKNDKKLLPVKWRDKEITLEMDGKTIDWSIINFATALILSDDLYQFVQDRLN